jgi:hypothetical protein
MRYLYLDDKIGEHGGKHEAVRKVTVFVSLVTDVSCGVLGRNRDPGCRRGQMAMLSGATAEPAVSAVRASSVREPQDPTDWLSHGTRSA